MVKKPLLHKYTVEGVVSIHLAGNAISACQNSVKPQMNLGNYTQIEKIPDFGSLNESVLWLDIQCNCIRKISPSISQLKYLIYLDLTANDLTNIAPEIGHLVHLEELHLDCNQLKELPIAIGQLTNLKVLSIEGNKLTDLPLEIGNLVNLKNFWIYGNEFSKNTIGKIIELLPNATIHYNPD